MFIRWLRYGARERSTILSGQNLVSLSNVVRCSAEWNGRSTDVDEDDMIVICSSDKGTERR